MLTWLLATEEHSAARRYLVSSAVWLCVAVLGGLFSAIQLFSPDTLKNIAVLEFGRVRPVHTSLMLFGFVGMMATGACLYITSVMLNTRLYSERLANLSLWVMNLALLGGTLTLPLGITQGREYAEWTWAVDVLIVVALLLLLYVIVMTVLHRKEKLIYVSVWYIVGAVLWTVSFYPMGNVMWHPKTGALEGTVDAIWLWFYGHNIFGLYLTPLVVAILYYMMPRIAKRPLYSHTLSLIGFWTLLAFYAHIGAHHLLQAPVPLWLKTLSVIDSVAMIIPVATVLVNLWLTTKDSLGEFARSVPGKWIYTGGVCYLLVCLQGPLQSLPSVQRYAHFNNWVVGHAHIAVLGFAGMIALGGLWYVLPSVSGRRLYSMTLANLQFWMILVGIVGFFAVLTIAGLIQGSAWVNGETEYRVLPTISPYMGLRLAFGLVIILAAFIGLYNVIMTLARGERVMP